MKRSTMILFLVFACLVQEVWTVEIDSDWMIVCGKHALPMEQQSAAEIAKYLHAVGNLSLKIASEPVAGRKMILVKSGKFASDEWSVKVSADGVSVSGGLPNGILYGAFEFIEKGLGCRFLAMDAEYVPVRKRIAVPDNLVLEGRPFFKVRKIYTGNPLLQNMDFRVFSIKSRQNISYASPRYGFPARTVGWQECHTYHLYAKAFPPDRQECFSLDKKGRRLHPVDGTGPGQLCLAQPDVRSLVVKKMAEMIENDHKSMMVKYPLFPKSNVIDFSQNDNIEKCVCPGCLALQKKYGGRYSGALLDCTNDVAAGIEKVYPGTVVQTFAYAFSEMPPAGIVARDNVRVQLAQLGAEFWVAGGKRDSLRGLSHVNNAHSLKMIEEWSKCCSRLAMWDYWKLFQQSYAFPYACLQAVAENLPIYSRRRFERVFSEFEMFHNGFYDCGNFFELGYYVGSRLMVDPYQNPENLIQEFLKYYYGAAAGQMRKLLDLIEQGMAEEKHNLGVAGHQAAYLNKDFFERAEFILSAAEQCADQDSELLMRIGQERITFDTAALELDKSLGLNLNRNQVIDRLQKNVTQVFKRYAPEAQWQKQEKIFSEHFSVIRRQLPRPRQFKDKKILDFPWFRLKKFYQPRYCTLVEDSDAAGGKSIRLVGNESGAKQIPAGFHSQPLKFGFYDWTNRKSLIGGISVPKDRIPQDEKYHWYHLGKTSIPKKGAIWIHWSWRMGITCTDDVYDATFPEKQYDIWLSLKLQGPSYVPNSRKQNAVSLDRIILVACDKDS